MDRQDRYLRFVLKYYAPGLFDSRSALRELKRIHGPEPLDWYRKITGIAAMLALCFAIGHYLLKHDHITVTLYAHDTMATYTLPDSSVITLFPHSTLSYDKKRFDTENRNVSMTGKVEFNVHRNPHIPFIAHSTYATLEVLGTQFTVDGTKADSVTTLSVTSGKVLFSAIGTSDGVVLTAGMHAELLTGTHRPTITEKHISETTLLNMPTLVFDNTPLQEVLATLGSHFNVILRTENLTDKCLSAEFETEDLNEIISIIEKTLDIKIITEKP